MFATKSKFAVALLLGIVIAAPCPCASAAEYPTKPVRLLVGFLAGGAADITARAIGQKLTAAFGQQVVIDNRAGAQGSIAAHIAAKAAPDGYTIYLGTVGNMAINVSLYGNLPYDPVKDFSPITLAVSSTNVLVVHPSVPAASVKELIALAKAKPGVLNYGSSGSGGAGHLAGELFKIMTETEIVHVPYKGGGPAMLDLISGQVQINFSTLATSLPQMKAGSNAGFGIITAHFDRIFARRELCSESATMPLQILANRFPLRVAAGKQERRHVDPGLHRQQIAIP